MSVNDNFDLKGFLKNKTLLKEGIEIPKDESEDSVKWRNLEDEMKWNLLLSAVKDPDEAEKYIEMEWNNLPSHVTSNIDWSIESEGQELDEEINDEGMRLIDKLRELPRYDMDTEGGEEFSYVVPRKETDGDWVKWDDVEKLLK